MIVSVLSCKVHKYIPKNGNEPVQGVKIFFGQPVDGWEGFLPIRNKKNECFSDFVHMKKLGGYVPSPGDLVNVEFGPAGGVLSVSPVSK